MSVCEGCGASLGISSKFCPHCGRAKSEPAKIKTAKAGIDSDRACPQCLQIDKVEKVSEIRRYQIQEQRGTMPVSRTFSDSNGNVFSYVGRDSYSGTQISNLAQALEPPRKPYLPKKHRASTKFLIVLLVWLGFLLGAELFFIGFIVFFGSSGDPTSLLSSCGGSIWLAISIYIYILWKKRFNKETTEYQHNLILYNENMLKWEEAVRKWDQLYYCYRDGCVFIPNTHSFAPISKMLEFVYS